MGGSDAKSAAFIPRGSITCAHATPLPVPRGAGNVGGRRGLPAWARRLGGTGLLLVVLIVFFVVGSSYLVTSGLRAAPHEYTQAITTPKDPREQQRASAIAAEQLATSILAPVAGDDPQLQHTRAAIQEDRLKVLETERQARAQENARLRGLLLNQMTSRIAQSRRSAADAALAAQLVAPTTGASSLRVGDAVVLRAAFTVSGSVIVPEGARGIVRAAGDAAGSWRVHFTNSFGDKPVKIAVAAQSLERVDPASDAIAKQSRSEGHARSRARKRAHLGVKDAQSAEGGGAAAGASPKVPGEENAADDTAAGAPDAPAVAGAVATVEEEAALVKPSAPEVATAVPVLRSQKRRAGSGSGSEADESTHETPTATWGTPTSRASAARDTDIPQGGGGTGDVGGGDHPMRAGAVGKKKAVARKGDGVDAGDAGRDGSKPERRGEVEPSDSSAGIIEGTAPAAGRKTKKKKKSSHPRHNRTAPAAANVSAEVPTDTQPPPRELVEEHKLRGGGGSKKDVGGGDAPKPRARRKKKAKAVEDIDDGSTSP